MTPSLIDCEHEWRTIPADPEHDLPRKTYCVLCGEPETVPGQVALPLEQDDAA